ncbi:hypothetical protein [Shimia biformata]|uniref:hypothetical protein n=1 Tax=Shimia biformata TaxID=1294299 RepID=UPI00194E1575|nr:hypothetical protein [Shimia biformata]
MAKITGPALVTALMTGLTTGLIAAPMAAIAEDAMQPPLPVTNDSSPWSFSLGLSTVGITGQVAYQVNDRFRLRGVVGRAPRIRGSENESGIDYTVDARIAGVSLLGDYFIGGSNFRLTFGAFLSGSSLTGDASGPLTVGDDVYNTTIQAKATFAREVAPILALGFDVPMGKNTTFVGTAGYIFTDGLTTNITVIAGDPVDPDDIVTEEGQLKNSIGPGYPFIELGVLFTF